MKENLQIALDNTEMVYAELVEIANDIVSTYTDEINGIVKYATSNVENLTNEDIRHILLKLSLKAYSFGDVKEKSALKAECAETLRKEKYATTFNSTEGSVATKDNTAILNSSDEILVESVYNLVASLLKVKLDELHRIVDSLKTVLTTRINEAKLTTSISEGE